ncbi:MAG: cytochrome c oxidase subunit II [SAR202 cluster bacterium]|nr:cytochrome c oxidase subunit II [SAR202 cluster bacterium]
MKKDLVAVAILWAVLTLVAEAMVLGWHVLPINASEEGQVVDDAYTLLTIMAAPVFGFVIATLAYSVFRFRRRGVPDGDGPPMMGSKRVVLAWVAVTSALTVLVIIHPGITGMLELGQHAQAASDLVVQTEGSRWAWKSAYIQHGVTSYGEIVLPVDRRVRFEVTSTDVVHSFWVPAFRMKVDAVPGLTTTVYITPNRTGSLADDNGFRLQCAELCGFGHYVMGVPVRVVEQGEFEAWIAQQGGR